MLLGVINHWPNELSAEAEFIMRFRHAGENLNWDTFVFDNYGRILSPPKTPCTHPLDEADALIIFDPRYIFFETTTPLVTPIWIPPELLSIDMRIDYLNSLSKIDYFVGGYDSASLREAYNHFLGAFGKPLDTALVPFGASVPKDFALAPTLNLQRRLFYAGVNCERILYVKRKIKPQPGRHNDLFQRLDQGDLISFYGPKTFGGIEPWAGFKNYCGDLPLDGHSVVTEISRCGAALCISSVSHLKYGIVSNRIFEAAAAGAVIISDDNQFVRKLFGDSVYYVDTADSQKAAAQIRSFLDEMNQNPESAFKKALRSHQIFLNELTLESYLHNLSHLLNKNDVTLPQDLVLVIDEKTSMFEPGSASVTEFIKRYGVQKVALIKTSVPPDLPFGTEVVEFASYEDLVMNAASYGMRLAVALPRGLDIPDNYFSLLLNAANASPQTALVIANLGERSGPRDFRRVSLPLKLHFEGYFESEILHSVARSLLPGASLLQLQNIRRWSNTSENVSPSTTYSEFLYSTLASSPEKIETEITSLRSTRIAMNSSPSELKFYGELLEWVYRRALTKPLQARTRAWAETVQYINDGIYKDALWKVPHIENRIAALEHFMMTPAPRLWYRVVRFLWRKFKRLASRE